jgi:Txe/YoeB family toxin of Txe-Axe toxin-antitoxin module
MPQPHESCWTSGRLHGDVVLITPHRIVYKVTDDSLLIAKLRYHY